MIWGNVNCLSLKNQTKDNYNWRKRETNVKYFLVINQRFALLIKSCLPRLNKFVIPQFTKYFRCSESPLMNDQIFISMNTIEEHSQCLGLTWYREKKELLSPVCSLFLRLFPISCSCMLTIYQERISLCTHL